MFPRDSVHFCPHSLPAHFPTGGSRVAKEFSKFVIRLILVASVIGFAIQQQIVRSRQEKIASAIESLQNTHGSAVGLLVKPLADTEESELIRRELQHRFDNATALREKLSLAFGLAGFGQVESEYLVSQIDRIEDSDTANLSNAFRLALNLPASPISPEYDK